MPHSFSIGKNTNNTQLVTIYLINYLINYNSLIAEQLNEIRKVSLAGILCANGDNIRHMQPFAMLAKSQL